MNRTIVILYWALCSILVSAAIGFFILPVELLSLIYVNLIASLSVSGIILVHIISKCEVPLYEPIYIFAVGGLIQFIIRPEMFGQYAIFFLISLYSFHWWAQWKYSPITEILQS